MRSHSDDELYHVQGRYLGPPGRTFLWQARYVAYVVWAAYAFAGLILKQQLGLGGGFLGYVLVAMVAVAATITTMRMVSPERPASAVLAMALAELRTPRDVPVPAVVTVSDPRWVRVHLDRPVPARRREPPTC